MSELLTLLKYLNEIPEINVILYTGRSESYIRNQEVIEYCDYVKCGGYNKNLPSQQESLLKINLASSNQHIIRGGRNKCRFL